MMQGLDEDFQAPFGAPSSSSNPKKKMTKAEKEIARLEQESKAQADFDKQIEGLDEEAKQAKIDEKKRSDAKSALDKHYREMSSKVYNWRKVCEIESPKVVEALIQKQYPKETAAFVQNKSIQMLTSITEFITKTLAKQPKGQGLSVEECSADLKTTKETFDELERAWKLFDKTVWNDMKGHANAPTEEA
eukprot:4536438-Pyramimonas_sp.AAC.1